MRTCCSPGRPRAGARSPSASRSARTDVVTELKEAERAGAEGRARRFGFRQLLVVGQIALSLALLTAAGLFARGAFRASRAEPGFSLDGSVLVSLDPSLAGFDEARGRELYRRVLERTRALPGVEAEAATLQGVRREIRALDERVPIFAVTTMRDFRDRSMSSWLVRASANLFAVFGGLAMFLSVVGVYGVRAYLVSRRSREIGIRMALGADARAVMWLVLREGLVLVAVGLGSGFVLAALTGLAVARLVYEVGAFDPLIFTLAPLLLALATLLACYIPARRATKVAPVVALRAE